MKRTDYTSLKELVSGVKVPEQTRTYKPVSNSQLIDLTVESIDRAGFKLDREAYTLSGDGQIATGRFTLSNVQDSEMQIQIAWQNSYNRMVSLKFAIGVHVMVCQNGCVSGDMGTFKKKHQGTVQEFTPTAISEYIKSAGDAFREMQMQREMMKEVELTKRQQGELLGRMVFEEDIISTMQLNIIRKELVKPSYDYGVENTLWDLYQHTTHSMKEVHPGSWMSDHMSAHSFFVNAQGELVTGKSRPAIISVPQFERYEQVELTL
jgi:hypothetical protein